MLRAKSTSLFGRIVRQRQLHTSKTLRISSTSDRKTESKEIRKDTVLPFAYHNETEAFGQLVKNYHQNLNHEEEPHVRVIPKEEIYSANIDQYGRADGKLPDGASSRKEARLQNETLEGMMNRDQVVIPERLTKAIYNHMLALHEPKVLKFDVAEKYVALNKDSLRQRTKKPLDVDVDIAAFFAQDYTSVHQVLSELFKRKPNFKPTKVLDVGYGPATGMLALNETMGPDFKPKFKDAVIVGDHEMKARAKILLSRQVCEYPGNIEELMSEESLEEQQKESTKRLKHDVTEDVVYDDFIGAIKTKHLKIVTQLSSSLNKSKSYNLIIAQHQLLSDISVFPYQVDDTVDELLQLLEPNGILVLVERGSPLGFESIARARQIMIRPERYENEGGKIPRAYIKGSSVKSETTTEVEIEEQQEEFLVDEEGNEVTLSNLEKELDMKFGEVDENQLEFNDLGVGTTQVSPDDVDDKKIDYHLSIVAPCAHHKACPLQTLKPLYYSFPAGKKLNWCKYEKLLERPRYLMELKRGKVLSSRWEKADEVSPSSRNGGSGRENSNNYEVANYSYLITERNANDSKTLDKISKDREEAQNSNQFSFGKHQTDSKYWPRILRQPMKRKGHVTMELCAPSGEIEKWTITKSLGKSAYFDSRKSHAGDLWGLDAKVKIKGRSNKDAGLTTKLENYEEELVKIEKKSKRLRDRKNKNESLKRTNEILNSWDAEDTEDVIEVYTNRFNSQKKQKQKDKRGGLQTYE